MSKEFGAIYTPEGHARILTTWAIQSKTDIVLDMGIGPGVFVYQAYERLKYLGASKANAVSQIYGSEIDKIVFDEFTKQASKQGLKFKNLQNANFFDTSFPEPDAIVGNPPYVRRRGMRKESLELIRSKTLKNNSGLVENDLSTLSDLYVYFLLSTLPLLRPGGRLATIIADSWLNTRYGIALKKYLLKEFEISQIISLDRSVFEDAQVKAVLLLAEKKKEINKNQHSIKFARVRNGLAIGDLSSFVLEKKNLPTNDIVVREIQSDKITAESSWGAILKSTALFDEISCKNSIKPIREMADIQIGLETLAKDFFVISNQKKEDGVVEQKYLKPFAYSVYDFNTSVIKTTDDPSQYLFYCSESKDDLKSTKAVEYIDLGEAVEVSIRGTNRTVIGYHNKERIQKARRPNWYDVKTEWDKKPVAEILLPRFIYKDYQVLWNAAGYIPGGAVIQFFPKENLFTHSINIKVYLAILVSSFVEIALRINAQMYGGGTSNLRITAVRETPMPDVSILTSRQITSLIKAYDKFLESNSKTQIDKVVCEILGLSKKQVAGMNKLLLELKSIAESAKKAAHPIE